MKARIESWIVVTLGFLLASCRTYPLAEAPPLPAPGKHPIIRPYIPEINESGLFHLSCTDRYPNGLSVYAAFDADKGIPSRATLAKRHFVHAAMASNTYRSPTDKPIFAIPDWRLLRSLQSPSGLLLDVYGNSDNVSTSTKLVVAYRGTDGASWDDWGNNLAPREPAQYREAYAHLRDLRMENSGAEYTVVGHSLGGGIALNMSLRFDGVDAVGFNPSPRIHFGRTSTSYNNQRTTLYEVGEVLNLISGPWTRLRLPDDTAHGNYNFLDYRTLAFSPIPEHGIYELTRGLLLVAMTRGDEAAQRMFAANIDRTTALKVDAEHCRERLP